ncbi:MAG: GIY-YIG nuclease family protein [Gemmatimonadales bacterium]
MFVYTLADPQTGEVRYVGQTCRSLVRRLGEHRYQAKRNRKHVYTWWRSLPQEPVLEVLEKYETPDAMDAGEIYWIEQLRALGCDLTNHSTGGDAGFRGGRHSEETKARLSTLFKGRKNPHIAMAIAASAAARRGKKLFGEHRNRVLVGLEKAQEAARSQEARIARSRSRGGTAVLCGQNGAIYDTAADAARALDLDPSTVLKVLRGKHRSTGGYTFKRVVEGNLTPMKVET